MDVRSPGRRARRRSWAVGIAAAAVALAVGAVVGRPESSSTSSSWTLPNADLRNTRHVGGPIDASSVSRLRIAWTVPFRDIYGTPVVANGIVYLQDLLSNVGAIDLRSGRVLWGRVYQDPSVGPNGLTLAGGRVFGATASHAFALDARSGRELWRRKLTVNEHDGIDMAPGYHNGTVYVSTVQTNIRVLYGPGARGVLWALDAATGRPRWRWAQVPAGLWGRPDVNGGGGLWHAPAFDGEGHLYVAVANPSPYTGTARFPWATSRPGPNRWTNSLVKLDERGGRMVWARQVLPHDIYDWDLQCPPILVRAGGRSLVVVAGKMGFVYAFERERGQLVWKRSVGVHNGHDRDNLRAMAGETPSLRRVVRVLPGQLGGVETPMATDGRLVYVPVVNLAGTYAADGEIAIEDVRTGSGELVALDLASGAVAWRRRLPHAPFGAATVANDLVFTTTYDGTVWAARTDTGAVVWRERLPNRTNTPVAVVGDTLIAAASVGSAERPATEVVAYRLGR